MCSFMSWFDVSFFSFFFLYVIWGLRRSWGGGGEVGPFLIMYI